MRETDRPAVPTLEDVARLAGVSRATVSRVVNGSRTVNEAQRQTVLEAVAEIGYVPNRAARSLITRRIGAVALVVSGSGAENEQQYRDEVFTDPFFGRVANGVLGLLRTRGIHPLLMLAENPAARDDVIDHLRRGSADGALVVSTHSHDPMPQQLLEAGVPTVLYARSGLPIAISYVDVAHRDGGALAAERLVAQGRTRVVSIAGPLDLRAASERLEGFSEAMARHGRPYVRSEEGEFTQASGEAAMRRLLEVEPELDGVFAANDLMALGALHVLQDCGRRVPEDVSVIGFDDSSVARVSRPMLTTVRQPVEDMAAAMADMLLERVEKPGMPPRSLIFDPILIVRQSG